MIPIITSLVTLFSLIVIFFLILPFLMVVISRFSAEKLVRTKMSDAKYKEFDYGCIITAYKNAEIAKPLIHSLLKQNLTNFHIYLVADECDISEFNFLHDKLTVLRPNPSLRLKAKSIIHAMENYVRPHEYTVIFDADNLAHPDFLFETNQYALAGYRAIQGQRTAKNLDTLYACLDALGEFYKNYIDRYVPYLIGSSSVISGSGMAVETQLYKAYLDGPEIQRGKEMWKKMLQEDKILQNDLLSKNEKIVYAWDAVVYDEKVTTGEQVETQRSRWLFSYFQNLPNSSSLLWKGLRNLSWNQLLFGLVTISPPLFILLFSALILFICAIFVSLKLAIIIFLGVSLFSFTILWTLYLSKAPKEIWSAIWAIPFFIAKQATGLFKMGNPNKNFKHTEHTRNFSIDEILDKK